MPAHSSSRKDASWMAALARWIASPNARVRLETGAVAVFGCVTHSFEGEKPAKVLEKSVYCNLTGYFPCSVERNERLRELCCKQQSKVEQGNSARPLPPRDVVRPSLDSKENETGSRPKGQLVLRPPDRRWLPLASCAITKISVHYQTNVAIAGKISLHFGTWRPTMF